MSAEEVLVVRTVTRAQAKQELLDYFRQNPETYPSDAAISLSLDPELARDLSEELVAEGKLEDA